MTSTELAEVAAGSLVLDSHQTSFTPAQVAALTHIGVEAASEGDLQVFHHVCQRTGLDPFARQIYMIGRKSRVLVDGRWQDGPVKQTIQTGIDGFRLIGRRAADAAKHQVSVSAPEWAHPDGTWRPVWVKAWGDPVAARVTIMRQDQPFTAIALFDEYAQTKSGGGLTSMWAQRPAGQLAKCAEALAWRMAFPQDLSGIYSDDEMGQADNHTVEQQPTRPAGGGLSAALAADPESDVVEGELVDEPAAAPPEDNIARISPDQDARIVAGMKELGITKKAEALGYVRQAVGRDVQARTDLTRTEADQLLEQIAGDLALAAADTKGTEK